MDSSSAQAGQQPMKPPPCRLMSTRSRLAGRDAVLRRVVVGMHATDRHIAPFDGKDLALTLEIAGQQRRNAVFLDRASRGRCMLSRCSVT